eukprot:2676173-Ditylum_brightwellii.AAC.1
MSMIIQEIALGSISLIACPQSRHIDQRDIGVGTKERHSVVGHEELAQMWNTWVQTGKGVLTLATQIDSRVAVRMFINDDCMPECMMTTGAAKLVGNKYKLNMQGMEDEDRSLIL